MESECVQSLFKTLDVTEGGGGKKQALHVYWRVRLMRFVYNTPRGEKKN